MDKQHKKLIKKLGAIAGKSIDDFFDIINEAAKESDHFIPFIFPVGEPKTEEAKKSEEEFNKREEWIHEQKVKLNNNLIAYTEKEGEPILLAFGETEIEVMELLEEVLESGEFDSDINISFR